jgi:hypothetical protein
LLSRRHLAARGVDRAADRIQDDLGAVVSREGVRREVFLRRELRLEVGDERRVARIALALSPASVMQSEVPIPSGPRYGMSVVKMLFICARGMQPLVAEVAPA